MSVMRVWFFFDLGVSPEVFKTVGSALHTFLEHVFISVFSFAFLRP